MYPAIMKSRFAKASIPVRLQGIFAQRDHVAELVDGCRPDGIVRRYLAAFRDGTVLRAPGEYRTCGKGLWLRGGEDATVVATALLQTLLLEQHVESAIYVNVHDLLDSESPDGESMGDILMADLMVLQGPGEQYKSASGWSDSVIFGLLRRRYDNGLPTLVATAKSIENSGLPVDFLRQVFTEVSIGVTPKE